MASLNDSVNMNTDNVGPVVTPNPAPAGTPPINYGSTTTRTTFPQPVPASPDVLGLWNARTSGLPTRGRLLPVSNTVVSSATSSGKAGSPGSPGASGSTGATGTRGSLWYEGAGAPGTITGQMNNDFYLDTSTGNVYELISGVWTFGINITGAAALQVTQVAHGLGSVGSIVPIYFKESSTNWQLAKADNANTLGSALAVVTGVNTFNVLVTGVVTGFTGLTAGEYYFVSDSVAGTFTTTEPTSPTSFSNPMIQALSATVAILLELRPCAIGVPTTPAVVQTATQVTASLAANATENDTITMAKMAAIQTVIVNSVARVRLYQTSAARTADATRPNSVPPTPGYPHQVIGDWYLDGSSGGPLTFPCSPVAFGQNGDNPQTTNIYAAITNLGASPAAITVNIGYIQQET